MSRCAILQSNYIPWKGYFDLIAAVDQFVIYDCVQYTKNDWRNRNKIKTASGLQWLTIPVAVPSLSTRIDEVKVSDQAWTKRHWLSLSQNYSKSNHYEYLRPLLEDFYKNCDEVYLSKINIHLIKMIAKALGIKTIISDSSEFEIEGDRNHRLLNLCKQLGADTYLSGPAAKSYLDLDLFTSNGLKVEWMEYTGYPDYTQRFPPFRHDVSVLDLLFNEGPDSADYMLHVKETVASA